MISISAKVLATIAAVLVSMLAVLAAYTGKVEVSVAPIEEALGAVGALISPLQVAGVHGSATVILDHSTFKTGTSTVCSFKLPNATTTGTVAAQAITVPFAQVFQIAVGLTPNATTTDLSTFTTTALSATMTTIFPPNAFINVKASTSSGTVVGSNFAPTGSCTINLTVI